MAIVLTPSPAAKCIGPVSFEMTASADFNATSRFGKSSFGRILAPGASTSRSRIDCSSILKTPRVYHKSYPRATAISCNRTQCGTGQTFFEHAAPILQMTVGLEESHENGLDNFGSGYNLISRFAGGEMPHGDRMRSRRSDSGISREPRSIFVV